MPDETTDVLDKIAAMQKRAADSGKHGYSSVFAETRAEIERLRAIVRVNGLRWGHTHAEVDAILQEQRHG